MKIVSNGKPEACIYLRSDCDACERMAAAELKKYVKQMTGAELSVRNSFSGGSVVLGEAAKAAFPEAKELRDDGFRMAERDGNLYVYGTVSRGTLYGVYTLLERWGCRFLAEDTEYVPETDSLEIAPGLEVTEEPAFEYRDLFWANTYDGNFAAKLKLDGAFLDVGDLGHPYRAEYGGGVGYAGPKFVHTFRFLLPAEEYFDEHPEYFSYTEGKRCGEHLKSQLCLTNPDVFRIVKDRVLDWLRENPTAAIVSVSQNDSYTGNYCECPACAAVDGEEGSHAGTLIRFVNKIAEAVEAEFPDVAIDTLAYQYSTTPPKITKPRRNVIVRMCTGGCYSHPITECAQNDHTRSCIETWGKVCRRQYIWDYTTNFGQYLSPVPNFRIFRKNMQFFRDNGVKGVFEQGNYQSPANGEFCELRCYVLSKLLWNPDADDKALIDEFFPLYYGAGSEYVRGYFDLLHEKTKDTHFAWNPPAQELWSVLTDEDFSYLEDLFTKAKDACREDAKALAHVKKTEISFRFVKNELSKAEFGNPETYDREWERFLADCREAGITWISESTPL